MTTGSVAVEALSSRTVILPASYTMFENLCNMKSWETPGIFYTMTGMASDLEISAIVTRLVQGGAFPGKPPCAILDDPSISSASLRALVAMGHVEHCGDASFSLTQTAMRGIITGCNCVAPKEVTAIPDCALESMDVWQLLLWMRSQGWSWRKCTKKVLPYRAHHPLIWSTSGKSQRSLHREYLLALCTFSDLTAKAPWLHRGPPQPRYT